MSGADSVTSKKRDIASELRRADARGVYPPQDWTTRAAEEIERLRAALLDLYNGTAEYVYLNNLGDPHNTTPMRNAAEVLGVEYPRSLGEKNRVRRLPDETPAKPARDAEHCDYPDCEQHWRFVAIQLRGALDDARTYLPGRPGCPPSLLERVDKALAMSADAPLTQKASGPHKYSTIGACDTCGDQPGDPQHAQNGEADSGEP